MVLTIFVQRPVTYELSIYAGLNAYAFVPLALVAALSYLWVERGRLWAFNVMVMTLCTVNLIFISLPVIKGYYYYGQYDGSAMVGYAVDILRNGYTYHEDFYPLAHVLVAQLCYILPAEPRFVQALLAPFMWGVFALGTSLVANQFEQHNVPLAGGMARCLACVFWLPAVTFSGFGYALPFTMTLELSAMVMYLLLGSTTRSRTLALAILLTSMTLYHPLIGALLATSILFASLFVARPLSSIFRQMGALTAVTLLGWIVYFALFRDLVTAASLMLTGEAPVGGVLETIAKLNLTPIGTIELFVKLYGHGVLALGLVALSYPILTKYVKDNKRLRRGLWTLYPFLFVSFVFMVPLFFVGALGFTPFRFYWFAVLVSIPGAIWTFLYVVKRMHHVRVVRFLAVTIIIVLWISSVLALYPSPYLLSPNDQVTRQMISPLQWLYGHHPDYAIPVPPLGIYNTRDMYVSVAGMHGRTGYIQLANFPNHFAYGNAAEIRALYGTRIRYPIYLVFDASVVEVYKELYSQLPRYTSEDLQLFLSNPSVVKTYDNGNSQVELFFDN
jgi:hypothetical protein